MTTANHPLTVRRLIQAPRPLLFEAFSRPDLLTKWFTPSAEISVEVLDFDFVANGRYRLRYHMPDGRQPMVGGSFEKIERPAQIILSWVWDAPDPLAGIPMRVAFRFVEKGNTTEVVITHEGIPTDASCTIHADGWEGTLGSLEAALAGGALQSTDLQFEQRIRS